MDLVALIGKDATPYGPFRLSARAKTLVALDTADIYFGDADYVFAEGRFETRRVRFECAVPLSSVIASATPPYVSVTAKLTGQYHGALDLIPKKQAGGGAFECDVRLTVQSRDGETYPPVSIHVAGAPVRDVRLLPPFISFPPAIQGAPPGAHMYRVTQRVAKLGKQKRNVVFVVGEQPLELDIAYFGLPCGGAP
jgi:hypothetical protein